MAGRRGGSGAAALASLAGQFRRRVLVWGFDAAVTTPDHRQGEHAECGLAALAIAMGGHGVHVRLEALRGLAGSTLHGVRIAVLRDLARSFGLQAGVHRAEIDALPSLGLPIVCHMRFIHFTVVEAVGPKHVRLNDPLAGPLVMDRHDFARDYTGLALRLAQGGEAAMEVADGRPFRLRSELAGRLRSQAPAIVLALAVSGFGSALLVAAATAAGRALDAAMGKGAEPGLVPAAIGLALAGLGAATAADLILGGALRRIVSRSRSSLLARMDALDLELLMLRSPRQWTGKLAAAGDLADPGFVRGALAVPAIAVLLSGLAMLSPLAAGAAAVSLLAQAAICRFAVPRGSPIARLGPGRLPVVAPDEEIFRRPDGWMLGGGEETLFARLAGLHAGAAKEAVQAESRYAGLAAMLRFNRALLLIVLAGMGGVALASGQSSLGRLGSVLALAALLSAQATAFVPAGTGARLRTALIALADFDALSGPPRQATETRLAAAGFAVELTSVAWRPAARLPAAVDGLSGAVEAGGVMAVVGPPGAGATTACRLIAGLLRPSGGEVLVAGAPPGQMQPGRIALVERGGELLAASVRSNLSLGEGFTDPEMLSVLDEVGLSAALEPRGGLGLVLRAGGEELSGGERARLLIARAMLRRPGLVVLDGVLDAVERERAETIVRALQAGGATVVLTSARIETLALADRVLRLDAPEAAAA